MLDEAKKFWESISGRIKGLIQDETKSALRLERYDVTTAPNGTKMGVTKPFGSTELMLPYSTEVANASVGDPVLVGWWGSMSNAKVCFPADGFGGATYNQVNITSGSHDLNDYNKAGLYWFSSGTTLTNAPAGVDGYLVVLKTTYTNTVKQYWHRSGSFTAGTLNLTGSYKDEYFRLGANQGWSPWTKVAVDVGYKIYNSVTDLGFTTGAAATTINAVYSAMPNCSILICAAGDFLSTEVPTTGGTVEIVRRSAARGWATLYGKRIIDTDYRLYFAGDDFSSANGWVPISQKNITSGSVDLNDYTTPGLYYFKYGVTLSNVPNSATNGWLYVLNMDNDGAVKQIWSRHGSNPTTFKETYQRLYASNAWGSWERMVAKSDLLDFVYPVGSIYTSTNSTSPASFLGGTWTRITGRFLLAATDGGSSGASQAAGNTGGGATVTLTTSQIPKHSHNIVDKTEGWVAAASGTAASGYVLSTTNNYNYRRRIVTDSDGGTGGSHTNMPPWKSVYMWERTA